MELCQGRGSGDGGQGLHQRAVGMEWAAQGSGHGPECRSSRNVWTALSDMGFDFGCVWSQELDLMTLVGPFQLRICHNSIIL